LIWINTSVRQELEKRREHPATLDVFPFRELNVGDRVPEITSKAADGRPLDLNTLHGKVVLLVFWGDWCPSCRSEYDSEREAAKTAVGKPFVLLGVNSDPDRSAIQDVIRSQNLPGRSRWEGGRNGPIAQAWNVTGWPSIYVLDVQGRIRIKGGRGLHIRRAVDALLAELEDPN
jgi:peroxiredoxin